MMKVSTRDVVVPSEGGVVANSLSAFAVQEVLGTIVVLPAADVLLHVVPEVRIVPGLGSRSTPFGSRVDEAALMGGVDLIASAHVLQLLDGVVGHLAHPSGVGAEQHVPDLASEMAIFIIKVV